MSDDDDDLFDDLDGDDDLDELDELDDLDEDEDASESDSPAGPIRIEDFNKCPPGYGFHIRGKKKCVRNPRRDDDKKDDSRWGDQTKPDKRRRDRWGKKMDRWSKGGDRDRETRGRDRRDRRGGRKADWRKKNDRWTKKDRRGKKDRKYRKNNKWGRNKKWGRKAERKADKRWGGKGWGGRGKKNWVQPTPEEMEKMKRMGATMKELGVCAPIVKRTMMDCFFVTDEGVRNAMLKEGAKGLTQEKNAVIGADTGKCYAKGLNELAICMQKQEAAQKSNSEESESDSPPTKEDFEQQKIMQEIDDNLRT